MEHKPCPACGRVRRNNDMHVHQGKNGIEKSGRRVEAVCKSPSVEAINGYTAFNAKQGGDAIYEDLDCHDYFRILCRSNL